MTDARVFVAVEPTTADELISEREKLLREKLIVDRDIATIRAQLDESKASGTSPRPGWVGHATRALRLKRARSQWIQTELKVLKQRLHKARLDTSALPDSMRFVEAAKTVLDRQTYLSIWVAADAMKGKP